MSETLPDSRLTTFLDASGDHALYFLEGQKLVRDLALVHAMPPRGFAYFRDFVLSIEPLIALMKGGEQLGFYVDSESPRFSLKIEASHAGDTRCLLFPADFGDFPAAMTGTVRVRRHDVRGGQPYESVIEATRLALRDVVNRVLEVSWQVSCRVVVSQASDQSAMLHRLPPLPGLEIEDPQQALQARMEELTPGLEELFARGLTDPDAITAALAGLGFRPIASRSVRFHCPCSRERFISQLRVINAQSPLFDPGQTETEVTCEYCRTSYTLTRAEVDAPPDVVH